MIQNVLVVAMVVVLCGAILIGFPVVFTLAGIAIIFAGIGWFSGVFDPAILSALPTRIFGTMTSDVLVAIPLFIFMGIVLERSRIAEDLLAAMGNLFGSLRGGIAISVTVVGAIMAASTGIVGATVVTMGMMALPTMLKRNYDPGFAAGTICAAGTLGQIIPPSTVLIILGESLSAAYQTAQFEMGKFANETISVGELFAGAMIPGLMLVGLYVSYQAIAAWVSPSLAPPDPHKGDVGVGGRPRAYLAALLPPLVLMVAVLGSILSGAATATEAASVGAVGAVLLAVFKIAPDRIYVPALTLACIAAMVVVTSNFDLRMGRIEITPIEVGAIGVTILLATGALLGIGISFWYLGKKQILGDILRSTMTITSMIFAMLIGASLFALVFRGLGGDVLVESFLTTLPGGEFGALIAVMAIIFLLGFFLDFVEIIIIIIPIVGPVLLKMDIDPIWLGVLIAVNLQTSFLTPPFGFALFYLRSVAPPEIKTGMIYRGVIPFILLQVLALILLGFVPELATWLPEKLF